MGSASSGIGYFGRNSLFRSNLGYFQFHDLSFMSSYQIILKSLVISLCLSENTKSPHESKSLSPYSHESKSPYSHESMSTRESILPELNMIGSMDLDAPDCHIESG